MLYMLKDIVVRALRIVQIFWKYHMFGEAQ